MESKKKVLIIDDEASITRLLKLVLEKSGRFEAACENEGQKAISAARAFKPDVILLDVNMPDANGGEISRLLQNDDSLKKIPVIFLTGNVTQAEAKSGIIIGGRPAMSKPIDMEGLIECIDKILEIPRS